ncbi:hypothetical protein [Paracoccus methylarcula]|uniref:DUF1311 domain-containing protein n=1 Tax=Paracoccus methylarcula TaxID=72022 RepID=A0A3R7LKK1_9RHOB|nr:hypothetical protein [Paracoccus methylarcula]RNF35012.1 hypothetical protein A7A09_008525 [Paracoccus methylarcula]
MVRNLLLALCLALPVTAFAEGDENGAVPQLRACVEDSASNGAELAGCIDAAHRECLQYPPDTAPDAAAKCFLDRKKTWGDAISEQMDSLKEGTGGQAFEIARIDTRYDLTANLLQCDRLTELAQLQDLPDPRIKAQQARCEATATGLTLIKLLLRPGAAK